MNLETVFTMDTSRIKSLTTGKVDADSMSFGPPKAGAGGPSWGATLVVLLGSWLETMLPGQCRIPWR